MAIPPWRTAWITGASSGIGRALALELAQAGVHVAVSARRQTGLDTLAARDRRITPFALDVTDAGAVAEVAREITVRLGPIDLVVFNAGIGTQMSAHAFDARRAGEMMAVNYQGLANGLAAVLPAMLARGGGHIALMASLAGYRGLPRSAAYSASKSAAITLAESLKPELDAAGVQITVINPGFVETPMMADAKHRLPFQITADDAARRIVAGLRHRKFEIAFPWPMVALLKFGRILPYRIYFWLMRRGGHSIDSVKNSKI